MINPPVSDGSDPVGHPPPQQPARPFWRARVFTLFPEMFPGPLAHSLAGKARDQGLWALETVDIRRFARDKHATVDGPPLGGGAGMVMRADVLDAALRQTLILEPATTADTTKQTRNIARNTQGTDSPNPIPQQSVQQESTKQETTKQESINHEPIIYLSPRGQPLTQERLNTLAQQPALSIVCGRYEGIDDRVIEAHKMEEISIGDYVLSGGEPAAMVVIDACVRLLPGVVGQIDSLREESFQNGLLEYPHYTHPRQWKGYPVPEILLSGNHGQIAAWRQEQAKKITQQRRPDLWKTYKHKHSET